MDNKLAIELIKDTICSEVVPTETLHDVMMMLLKLLMDTEIDIAKLREEVTHARTVNDLVSKTLQYVTMVTNGNLFVDILDVVGLELKSRQDEPTSSSNLS